jgi:demethylmenaquinone methyltransferase/2-methoxy-6-polyprenyl-1,4-benzoquinol methylase
MADVSSQDRDAAQTFYTRISVVYDVLADRGEHRARQMGLSVLGARPGERILEVGFGTGSSIVALAAAVGEAGHVSGVDISAGMKAVAEARVRSAQSTTPIELGLAAVPPLPFGDAAFDAVFMAFTLELFPDDTMPFVLREVRRTLRPAGRLAVVSMTLGRAGQAQSIPERVYGWMHRHFPHVVDCRPIDVERRLSDAGFGVIRTETLDIWGLPVMAVLAGRGRS